jgi:hypothetical protein
LRRRFSNVWRRLSRFPGAILRRLSPALRSADHASTVTAPYGWLPYGAVWARKAATYALGGLGTVVALPPCMSTRQKKPGMSVRSAKKVAKVAKSAAKQTESAVASEAGRRHPGARRKHTRATLQRSPGRARRFLDSTPVRVLLGVSAMALVLAKLKHLV